MARTLVGLVAVAMLVAGAVLWVRGPGVDGLPTQASAEAAEAPEPPSAPWRAGAPRRLLVPDLGVRAPVRPVELAGEVLVPPSDPQRLGWWAGGAEAGADEGRALVVGHAVEDGDGALDELGSLGQGARVRVHLKGGGTLDYEVTKVREYTKGRLREHAERVFTQTGPPRLVLVTCSDWDGERYRSNVVAVARPVR